MSGYYALLAMHVCLVPVLHIATLPLPPTPMHSALVCTHSLRALFGTDKMQNAVHGSSNKEKAEAVIKEFFEGVEFNPDGTIKVGGTGGCIMWVGCIQGLLCRFMLECEWVAKSLLWSLAVGIPVILRTIGIYYLW